ncbi:hypothetical protein F4677DRAFT_199328 [Hypoxylon crocopeplum]|nr:hypothetical protein F4677DRAFT_199328 [Hypoxylon crocopeplum]
MCPVESHDFSCRQIQRCRLVLSLTFLLAVVANHGRFVGAILGHVAFLLAVSAFSSELLGRSSRAVADQMALLIAVATFQDARVGAFSLVVTEVQIEAGSITSRSASGTIVDRDGISTPVSGIVSGGRTIRVPARGRGSVVAPLRHGGCLR